FLGPARLRAQATAWATARRPRWRQARQQRPQQSERTSEDTRFAPLPAARVTVLVGEPVARAAELLGEVLELRQAVVHGEHLLAVVHVQRRLEGEAGDRARGNVGHSDRRVQDEDRAAAARAELAVTGLGPLERAELVRALHDLDVRRGPERRGVDRRAQPAAARAAVAVGLDVGLAGQLDLDRATETTAL